jgi:hypothetical protein
MSIEDLEAKMKKIYQENEVLIKGDYTVLENKPNEPYKTFNTDEGNE